MDSHPLIAIDTMRGYLLTGGTLVTGGASSRLIENGWVWIEGGKIRSVGTPAQVRAASPDIVKGGRGIKRLDLSGRLVMPGFICAHHHLYSTFARGMPLAGYVPRSFGEVLEGLWWKLDRALLPGDVYLSAVPSLIDALRHGVTTVIDHHESQGYQDGVLDELERACRDVGVRACLTLGASDRGGHGAAGVLENERFIRKCAAGDGLVRAMAGLHASFTVGQATLAATVDLARRTGAGIHVHLAEDPLDVAETRRQFSNAPTVRLNAAGALGPRTIVAHAIHMVDAGREVLAASGAWVAHCPESNMNNGVGLADILKQQSAGIRVALGTDGMSSDMLAQARLAYLAQRHLHGDPSVGFNESVTMLLSGNAQMAAPLVGATLGELAPGAAADVACFEYAPPTPLHEGNLAGHLLFGLAGARADVVIVEGQLRLFSGRAVGVDEDEVASRARDAAARLWKRTEVV